MAETVLGTRGEADSLSSLPRLEQVAGELGVPTGALRTAFRNQTIHMNPSDRVPWEIVALILEAELEAGRPVVPAQGVRRWR